MYYVFSTWDVDMQHWTRIWIRALSLALTNVYICKCSKRRDEATPELFFPRKQDNSISFPPKVEYKTKVLFFYFLFLFLATKGHYSFQALSFSVASSYHVLVLCSWWRSLYWTEVFLYFYPALLIPSNQGKLMSLLFIWSFYRSQCSLI